MQPVDLFMFYICMRLNIEPSNLFRAPREGNALVDLMARHIGYNSVLIFEIPTVHRRIGVSFVKGHGGVFQVTMVDNLHTPF